MARIDTSSEILSDRPALRSGGVSTLPDPAAPGDPGGKTEAGAGVGEADELPLLELQVGAIAAGGGCVGRAPDGKVVFVRHSLPGELVRAKVTASTSSYLRADAVEILTPSPDRVVAPCPHAGPGRCGGCDFQHVELGAQRRLKAFRIAEQLERLAGPDLGVEVEPVAGDDDGLAYRTRVRLAVDGRGAMGFRRHRSHRMEYVQECPIASPAVSATGALEVLWPGATEFEVVTGTDPAESMVSVTPRRRSSPRLPDLGRGVGVVVGGKVRRPPAAVHAVVAGHTYRISPGVFWQVHAGAAAALLSAVLDLAGPCEGATVADLYAGAGLFSVPLAERVGPSGSVLAVERDRRACADARHNGATFPHLRVLEGEVTPALVESALGQPDIVVLDPAREGAGTEVMSALAGHGAVLSTLIYVSCDPASFGRDIRVLLDEGWRVTGLRAFDIFPMTEHVELVAALEPPARAGN
jgi:tRNA/tmRNA/rRNA uracil-C5-methylase (TrmA/RlmC/RlmD family)